MNIHEALETTTEMLNKIELLGIEKISKTEIYSLEESLKDITEQFPMLLLRRHGSDKGKALYREVLSIKGRIGNLRKYLSYKDRVILENKKINALNEFIDFFVRTFGHVDNLKFKTDGSLIKKQKELLPEGYNITASGIYFKYSLEYFSLDNLRNLLIKDKRENITILSYKNYRMEINKIKDVEFKIGEIESEIKRLLDIKEELLSKIYFDH